MRQVQSRLQRLERRDWWLWWTAIVVTLLLTAGVVVLAVFAQWLANDPNFQESLRRLLYGLVGTVLLFNLHTIYQQILVKRLRRQLAEQIGTIASLETRAEDLRNLAAVDPLTGLYNRRIADEHLEAEVTRSHRHGHPLAVAMFDLNEFKEINDHYGHAAGDLVLKEFARRLRKSLRNSDEAARVGGDEFLAVLPECKVGMADRVLTRLGSLEIDLRGQRISFTFSAGVAEYQPGEPVQSLLDRADKALYDNKRARKGRIRSVMPEPVTAHDADPNP